jgi:hypothetical protein
VSPCAFGFVLATRHSRSIEVEEDHRPEIQDLGWQFWSSQFRRNPIANFRSHFHFLTSPMAICPFYPPFTLFCPRIDPRMPPHADVSVAFSRHLFCIQLWEQSLSQLAFFNPLIVSSRKFGLRLTMPMA